ncbi:MAG: DUF4921 family protein [Pirellulales bacterium]|nr:DUF4921 family protein [Planctomycetales bacterium]
MPELRRDPVTGQSVVIAESRSQRPGAFEAVHDDLAVEDCPFCEGSEHLTPGEVAALRYDGTEVDAPGWQVRVVPNKYPATSLGGDASSHVDASSSAGSDWFVAEPAIGSHEVIIESPRHIRSVSELGVAELADAFRMYAGRLAHHRRSGRARYAMVFKNVGSGAGASMPHTHSQLITLPSVPAPVARELRGSLEFYANNGRCVYCELIDRERGDCARVVAESKWYVAICPFASRFPYEVWLLPRNHASSYETSTSCQSGAAASLTHRVLRGVERLLGRPDYNYVIHTAPFDTETLDHYHWRLELIPRLSKIAGFELGAGVYINPVAPETAARQLREVLEPE